MSSHLQFILWSWQVLGELCAAAHNVEKGGCSLLDQANWRSLFLISLRVEAQENEKQNMHRTDFLMFSAKSLQ